MPDFTPEQQRLEELVERCLAEAADAMETNEGFLFEALTGAKDWEDAKLRLLECYPKLSVSVLADVLHRGLVAAECWGRLTALTEAETADFAADDPADIRLEPLGMKEAVDFWRDKILLDPEDFNRLDDRAKLRAFSVAGIAKGQALEDIYQALLKSLENGTGFEQFKQDVGKHFGAEWDDKAKKWIGGDIRRMDNIFRTNLQTAYNIGRYAQQKEGAKYRPYLLYSAVNDSRTRPVHRALDGLIYHIDHPFWDTWYPPNGFRCRCGTQALTKGQIERRGLRVETDDVTGSERDIDVINKTTGEILKQSVAIVPEPGWAFHPGKAAWGGLANLTGEAAKFEPLDDLPGPTDYENVPDDLRNIPENDLPVIESSELFLKTEAGDPPTDADYERKFQELYGDGRPLSDVLGELVHVSLRLFQQEKDQTLGTGMKTAKRGHGEVIPLVKRLLLDPLEVWLTPQIDANGKVRLSKRYISAWKDETNQRLACFAVFEMWRGVLQGVTAFLPRKKNKAQTPDVGYVNKQRRGLLLHRRGVGRPRRQGREKE